MLIPAIVLITGALLAYTTGVWAERRSGVLKPWHAGFFALGLALDVAGTATMSAIARSGQAASTGAAGFFFAAVEAPAGRLPIRQTAASAVQ